MIKALDVTDQVKPLMPDLGDRRVAMSAGTLAAADNRDEAKRLQFVTALGWRLLHDPRCARSRIDERQTTVAPPVGPRFVLIEGESPDGTPATAIVTVWEWMLHAGPALEPEVEVLERNTAVEGGYLN